MYVSMPMCSLIGRLVKLTLRTTNYIHQSFCWSICKIIAEAGVSFNCASAYLYAKLFHVIDNSIVGIRAFLDNLLFKS